MSVIVADTGAWYDVVYCGAVGAVYVDVSSRACCQRYDCG